ncbi:MAG TPA: hypothetical protein VH370_23770 [Humisphaera sp.]|nr:hypothetical protein [Humisphaera sp.]
MVYDKAKWHSDGDFPKGLPYENGGTHVGMFLAWVINHGMAGPDLTDEAASDLEEVRQRRLTGRTVLFNHLDGVLSDEDLNDEGNAFAKHYYQKYQGEYDALIRRKLKTAYHASDDWATYDMVAAMIDRAYSEFRKASGGPKAG